MSTITKRQRAPTETPAAQTENPTEQAALAYLSLGWSLLPLRPGAKEPYAELLPKDRKGNPSWRMLALEPATKDEVQGWFRADPDANIGVILGEASGGLGVIDVDRPLAMPLHLPPSVQSQTARGAHIFYTSDKPLKTRKCTWGELRSDGAYVALPPSKHPSGAVYTWSDFCSPMEHPLTEMPADLVLAIEEEQKKQADSLSGRVSKTSICSYAPSPVPGKAVIDLVSWVSREDVAFALLGLCGVTVSKLGQAFRCPLPGHTDRHPSAALWRQPDGTIGFHDFHQASGPAWFSLAEMYASCRAGRVMKLRPGEKAAWLIRGLAEAGLLKTPRILAPKLPKAAPPVVRAVYAGFQRLLEYRAVYNADQEGAPFAWGFASAWCGKGERHTGEAIKWLIARGYLRVLSSGKRQVTILALGTPGNGSDEK